MKNLLTLTGIVLLSLIAVSGKSQSLRQAKTPTFSALPNVIECSSADLGQFFLAARGTQKVKTNIANKLNVEGNITTNTVKFSNLHSIGITLPEFKNAVFSISKRTDANNKIVYVGHIFPQNSTDGYELKKTGEDTYQLIKVNMEDILPTCAQM